MREKLNCILLIDDDEVTNFLNAKILNKIQVAYEIKIVKNGLEALQFITSWNESGLCPELILLDLHMPVLDGFEFMNSFSQLEFENKDSVQIAVITSSDNPNDLDMARSLGIKHYFMKPFKEETMKAFFANELKFDYIFSRN